MDQILRGVASTISVVFTVNGNPTNPDPDSATVTITRDSDGSTVVEDEPAVDVETVDGQFSHTLAAEDVEELDILTAAWTATFDGEAQTLSTEVEVVGGFLFRIDEARTFDRALVDTAVFSAAQIVQGRTLATQAIEDACGVAFTPRYARQTTSGLGTTGLPLTWPLVRSVRSASVDGQALTSGELLELSTTTLGLDWQSRWHRGISNISIVYEHGYDRPPSRATLAGIRLCRHYLTKFPLDDRTTRFDTESGSYTVAQPGIRGQAFGIPEVDSFVTDYNAHVQVV